MKIYTITTTTCTKGTICVAGVETFADCKAAEVAMRRYFTSCVACFTTTSANYDISACKVTYSNGNWIDMHLCETEVAQYEM